jgi:hypothetical protein
MRDPEPQADVNAISSQLDEALKVLEELSDRIAAGEEIDDKELAIKARTIAEQMEEVRLALEKAVGPIDRETLREQLRQSLTPEEYSEWLATEPDMMEFRRQYQEQRPAREALREDVDG